MFYMCINCQLALSPVYCLDLETLEKFEANNRIYQNNKIGESADKITSRLGALQCIAKSLPVLPVETTASLETDHKSSGRHQSEHEPAQNESKSSTRELGQPQVILLPPFEGGEDDKHDENQSFEDEPTQPPSLHQEMDFVEDDNLEEQGSADDQTESVEASERHSKASFRGQNHRNWTRKRTFWDHLKRPLGKLQKGNSTRRLNTRNSKHILPRRFKRQALNFIPPATDNFDSNSLVNIIVRALTSTTSSLTSSSQQGVNTASAARNLMQQVLASITLIAQQLMSALVRQTAADIPRHASNLGQLFANLLTVLTIENPLVANSPFLTRLNNNTGQVNTILRDQTREQVDSIERTLRLIRELARETMRTAVNLSSNMMTTPQASQISLTSAPISAPVLTTTTATPVELANNNKTDNITKDEHQDSKLIDRLMKLTSENFNQRAINSPDRQTRSHIRTKRSLGTLLLFGPFSKFYMAMMINRVIKYQSSVLSQAVVGELIRRFVVPSVSSSLAPATAGVTNLLSQVKNTLGNNLQVGASYNQLLQAAKMSVQSPIRSEEKINLDEIKKLRKGEFEGKRSARPVLFDPDCQLADPGGLKIYQDLIKNSLDPKQLLFNLASMNRSAISFDQQGLTIDTPNSKVTIPSLRSSQEALIKLIRGSNDAGDVTPGFTELNSPFPPKIRPQQFASPYHHYDDELFKTDQHFYDQRFHLNHSNPTKGLKVVQSPYDFGAQTNFGDQALMGLLANQQNQQFLQQPRIPNENLSNASLSQLLDLLAQLDSQQQQKSRVTDDQIRQKTKLIDSLSNFTLSNSSIHSNENDRLLTTLMENLIANRERPSSTNLLTSADSIAEKILNKTLEAGLLNLIQANKLPPGASNLINNNNNKLVKDTSDLLVDSFAHLIKGLEFDVNSTKFEPSIAQGTKQNKETRDEVNSTQKPPIQIMLTPENAASLVGELMSPIKKDGENSTEGTSNLSKPLIVEHEEGEIIRGHEEEESIITPAPSIESNQDYLEAKVLQDKKAEISSKLPPQTIHELNQLIQVEKNHLSMKELAQSEQYTTEHSLVESDQQALEPINPVSVHAESGEETKVNQHRVELNTIQQNKTHVVTLNPSSSHQIQVGRVMSAKTRANQPNSTQFYPGYVQNLDKDKVTISTRKPQLPLLNQKISKVQHQNKPKLSSPANASSEKLLRADSVNILRTKQVEVKVKAKPDPPKPIGLVINSKLPQRTNSYERQAKDQRKNNSQKVMPVREAQASTLIHHVSPKLSNQVSVNKTDNQQQQQQQNLNNIAMALNVMNMVLLNQKLANSSDSSAKLSTDQLLKLEKQRKRSKHRTRYKHNRKLHSNSTSSTSKPLDNTPRTPDFERENNTAPNNHRTQTNRIKSSSKLLVAKSEQNVSSAARTSDLKPTRYSFQPLVVDNSSITNSLNTTEPGHLESDVEYANRWNDVLAHLNLAAS